MTTEETETSDRKYRPFSNGTEFDIWHSRNCQQCQLCSIEDSPTCPGDEGLTLALFDDGEISAEICDFIGTTHREIEENDGFCTLNRQCNHFQARI